MLISKHIILAVALIMLFKEQSCVEFSSLSLGSNQSHCACPGDQLTFDCLVEDGVATVWQGSAFDCNHEGPNMIILRHSQFSQQLSQPAGGECNDGRIVARSIGPGVLNGTYLSELNVTVSEDMNNKTTECVAEYINGTQSNSGTSTVTVATGKCIALLSY